MFSCTSKPLESERNVWYTFLGNNQQRFNYHNFSNSLELEFMSQNTSSYNIVMNLTTNSFRYKFKRFPKILQKRYLKKIRKNLFLTIGCVAQLKWNLKSLDFYSGIIGVDLSLSILINSKRMFLKRSSWMQMTGYTTS